MPAMQKKKPAKVPVHGPKHSNQVRIIGGDWKRTPLPVLEALGLRPTPDRVRETVFNWINHLQDGAWSETQVLDLFAGSGALGFEAASRGAAKVTMVDANSAVVRQLESNREKLKATNIAIQRGDAPLAFLRAHAGAPFDIAFVDPPFAAGLWPAVLELLPARLAAQAWLYVESPADQAPELPAEWALHRENHTRQVRYALYRRGTLGQS